MTTHSGTIRASVIIPTYNGVAVTRACVESLIAAGFDERDELIVVDNCSTDGTREFLAALDGSVTVILNDTNRNFAGACNQGAAAARGEYVVLLNNDTEVTPGWLDALIMTSVDHDADVVGARLLYPDGRIQHAGIGVEQGVFPRHLNRYEPGTSPRASVSFECQIVTGACMLVRTATWTAVGGLDERFRNGCEDIDLCLRIRAAGGHVWYAADSIVTHHESLSPGRNDHDDANAALLFALHRDSMYGDRISGDRIVELAAPTLPWRRSPVRTSIIIPLFNRVDMTRQCIESIFEVGLPEDAEVVVVDNASTDGTQAYCDEIAGRVRVVRKDTNVNFAGACNVGMSHALGTVLVFLNNDTVVTPGWLDALTAPLADPRIGIVGGRLLYPDGKVQHAGVAFGDDRVGFHINAGAAGDDPAVMTGRTVQAVTGACLAIDREVFLKTRFDTAYRNGCEDLELCLRAAQLGVQVWYEPSCVVYHHESQSAGRFDHASANLGMFLDRWRNVIVPDVHTFVGATTIAPDFPSYRSQSAAMPARSDVRESKDGSDSTVACTVILPRAERDFVTRVGDLIASRGLTDVEVLSSDAQETGHRSWCDAAGELLDAATGDRIAIVTPGADPHDLLDCIERANYVDGLTDALPEIVAAPFTSLSGPAIAVLSSSVVGLLGGFDPVFDQPGLALHDLLQRAALAGVIVTDQRANGVPMHHAIVDATAQHLQIDAWSERWNISSARVGPRPVVIFRPIISQRASGSEDLTFPTRTATIVLSWRGGDDREIRTAAQQLLTRLGPDDDATIVVRVGTDATALAAFEDAAADIADAALPDIVIVDGGLDIEHALCDAADVVFVPSAGSNNLRLLTRRAHARTLEPDTIEQYCDSIQHTPRSTR